MERLRRRRGLSVLGLSRLTADMGHEIPRMAITNLEAGSREAITTAELLILAGALDVPPLLLLFPFGVDDPLEPIPDGAESAALVLDWLGSRSRLSGERAQNIADPAWHVIDRIERHRSLVERIERILALARFAGTPPDERQLTPAIVDIASLRHEMTRGEQVPPALPEAVDHLVRDLPVASWEALGAAIDTLGPGGVISDYQQMDEFFAGLRDLASGGTAPTDRTTDGEG